MTPQNRRFATSDIVAPTFTDRTPGPTLSDPSFSERTPTPEPAPKTFPSQTVLHDGTVYETHFTVCPDPLCPCCELGVRAFPENGTDPRDELRFEVDVELWDLVPDKDPYVRDPRVESLVAAWTGETWNRLFQAFHDAKHSLLDDVELEELEGSRPFAVDEIEGTRGRAVGWNEIVPFDVQISVETDEFFFVVDDSYDVRSNGLLRTDDVLLTFLSGRKLEQVDPHREPFIGPVSVAQVNLHTGSRQLLHEEPGAPLGELLDLTLRLPDVKELFAERRRILRTLYARHLDAIGFVPEPLKITFHCFLEDTKTWCETTYEIRTDGLAEIGPEREPARSRKIGRNQPCPCGSGDKYKKCCGP